MRKRPFCWVFLLFFLASVRPVAAAENPRLVILAVDRLTLQDLLSPIRPNLRRLIEEGATGLMTTRAVGGTAPEKIYLSIGAGEPQTAPPGSGGLAFEVDELYNGLPAGEVYRLQTGKMPPPDGVVLLNLSGLAEANLQLGLPHRLGWLGEALREQGFRLAILGNADTKERYGREGVLLLVDRYGRIERGRVGLETLRQDPSFPGGWRTDYSFFKQEYGRTATQADIVLIILGDLARLYAAGQSITPQMFSRHLSSTLDRIDDFLGWLLNSPRRPETILLFTPSPPLARLAAGERLVPVVLWGQGFSSGLLYSSSTRLPGVVTPYDLTATIAHVAGTRSFTTGYPLRVVPGSPVDFLPRFYTELIRNLHQRTPFFFFYGFILLVMACLGLLPLHHRWSGIKKAATTLLLGLALLPTVLLLLALWPLGPLWQTFLLAFSLAFGGGWLLERFLPSPRRRLGILGLLVAGPVLLDLLKGSPLLVRSLLGYSPVLGARFYGLGNEYLGVTLGGLILAGCAFYRPSPLRKWVVITVFILTVLIISLPQYGANIGGGITGVIGLGATFLSLQKKKLGRRELAFLFLGVFFLLALLGLYELIPTRREISHFGQLFLRLKTEGPTALYLILRTKTLMFSRVLGYTDWSWVLLVLVFIFPWLLAYPPRPLAAYFKTPHYLHTTLRGLWLTSLVGLLSNDSGLVVAAVIWIYLGLAFVYLIEEKRPGQDKNGQQGNLKERPG